MTPEREKEIREQCEQGWKPQLSEMNELLAEVDRLRTEQKIDGVALAQQRGMITVLREKLAAMTEAFKDAINTIHGEYCAEEHHGICIDHQEALDKLRGLEEQPKPPLNIEASQTILKLFNEIDQLREKLEHSATLEKCLFQMQEAAKDLSEKLAVAVEALDFYGNKDNWKDVWEYEGRKSDTFKYFYILRQRTNDFDREVPHHYYYAGKRAREALSKIRGEK